MCVYCTYSIWELPALEAAAAEAAASAPEEAAAASAKDKEILQLQKNTSIFLDVSLLNSFFVTNVREK